MPAGLIRIEVSWAEIEIYVGEFVFTTPHEVAPELLEAAQDAVNSLASSSLVEIARQEAR